MSSAPDLTAIAVWKRGDDGALHIDHVFEFPIDNDQLLEAAMRQLRQVYPLGQRPKPSPVTIAPKRA